MSPVIRISDEIFARLQANATPLVDTPASVIEKILDFFESHQQRSDRNIKSGSPSVALSKDNEKVMEFDPDNPPDLTHTDVITAKFDGIEASNWNELIRTANGNTYRKLGSFTGLRSLTKSHVKDGRYELKGFHYIPDLDVSIQNVEADMAWSYSLHLARKMNVPISVHFQWKDTPKAAHPGSQGILFFQG